MWLKRGVRRFCGLAFIIRGGFRGIIIPVARLIRAVDRDLIRYSHLSAEFYPLVTTLAKAVTVITRIFVQPLLDLRKNLSHNVGHTPHASTTQPIEWLLKPSGRSCTSSLRIIPIARQSGTIPLSPPV